MDEHDERNQEWVGVATMIESGDPLDSVRVVDLAEGDADLITRLWADLGADVLKVATPGDDETPGVLVGGVNLPYALHNANKRHTVLDPASTFDVRRFHELASTADIVVDSGNPGRTALFNSSCEQLCDQYPHLVTMSVTDFGRNGPLSAWIATDAVLYAMSPALSRSRNTDDIPALPPDGLATATAAAQAAWAGMVAYYRRLRCGQGEFIDFSRYEAVLQALDPPFGSQGQAAAGRKKGTPRKPGGRRQDAYPIFACKDGWVRICVLAPRQWRGLRAWLDEPAAFQDPVYDSIGARFAAFDEIGLLVADHFATETADQLVSTGARFGVPVAALATPREVLTTDHFRESGTWTHLEIAPGTVVTAPDGCVFVDGVRRGLRHPPASVSVDEAQWSMRSATTTGAGNHDPVGHRPFEGLRILDLGVIVAGGELGRLFSDLGAEVVKIESAQYPDGLRQTRPGQLMSESFAWTHRNQTSIGLNLRDPDGRDVFGQLVSHSDVVFANFKPGTLAALGFSYAQLREANPRVVLAESSAYGDRGPWKTRMGYGPLVRASTGITGLWTADVTGTEGNRSFCDSTTVFPDHVVARITALAALALLIRRERTGSGGHVHVSQAEAAINQLDVVYAAEAARSTGLPVLDDQTIHFICPCDGDDAWCVVSIRDDRDWHAVTSLIHDSALLDESRSRTQGDRFQHRADIQRALRRWTTTRDAGTVADVLQGAGVPAARMHRAADVLDEPQVLARRLYTDMTHPLLEAPLPTETAAASFRSIPRAELRPAPLPGEHTREVCQRILALDADAIDDLIVKGVLSESTVPTSSTVGSPS
jgi:crotonobetainyl-CoA:carnitine CoA-transferase CaiB-like acyl-CoA transferase